MAYVDVAWRGTMDRRPPRPRLRRPRPRPSTPTADRDPTPSSPSPHRAEPRRAIRVRADPARPPATARSSPRSRRGRAAAGASSETRSPLRGCGSSSLQAWSAWRGEPQREAVLVGHLVPREPVEDVLVRPVDLVADERQPGVEEVRADLVLAAGPGAAGEERDRRPVRRDAALELLELRDAGVAARGDVHADADRGGAGEGERRVHGEAPLRGTPERDGEVGLRDAALGERPLQPLGPLRRGAAGEQPGGLAVEPVGGSILRSGKRRRAAEVKVFAE